MNILLIEWHLQDRASSREFGVGSCFVSKLGTEDPETWMALLRFYRSGTRLKERGVGVGGVVEKQNTLRS